MICEGDKSFKQKAKRKVSASNVLGSLLSIIDLIVADDMLKVMNVPHHKNANDSHLFKEKFFLIKSYQ